MLGRVSEPRGSSKDIVSIQEAKEILSKGYSGALNVVIVAAEVNAAVVKNEAEVHERSSVPAICSVRVNRP